MKKILQRLLLLPLLFSAGFAAAIEEDELLPVEEAYIPTVTVSNDVVTVAFKVAPGYYLYKERTSLETARPEEVVLGPFEMPEGEKKTDEFFGEMHVFHKDFEGTAKLSYPGVKPALYAFRLKYQGCADIGVCYPPQTRTFAMDSGYRAEVPPPANPSDPLALAAPSLPQDSVPADQMVSGITEAASTPLADPVPATSAPDPLGLSPATTTPSLIAAQDALPEAQAFRAQALATDGQTVLVRIAAPADYYLYRDKFVFLLNAEGVASAPEFPKGKMISDEHFGDVEVYFGGVDIPLKLTRTSAAPGKATLAMEFQGCKQDSVCYPVMRRVIDLDLPSALAAEQSASFDDAPIAATTEAVALNTEVTREEGAEVLPQILTPGIVLDAIARATGQKVSSGKGESSADVGLLLALLLALVGGVLLNLMPCVLPVLSLKILGLVESGTSAKVARTQAIWYTVGVLVSFFALGLILLSFKSAGAALGWGFQLQNPLIVGALAFLLIAMGLNLSGVVSFGHSLGNVGTGLTQDSGARGAFFNGVLACVVATPCTGPGMFTALGYGFTQSNTVAMLILLTLGLGLALPFLLIGFLPALARLLPKPGAWMETLKAWLAFPLYLTAVWLLGVLGQQVGIDGLTYALAGAVLLAAGLWWWEKQRYSTRDSTMVAKTVAISLVLGALLVLFSASKHKANLQMPVVEGQIPYSAAKLAELRKAGTPVFVDMTAAWCITCKVNERNAINTYAVGQAMQQNGVVYMVGDYTNADPAITAYLKAYGAVGVPLYVMYPKVFSGANP